MRNSLKPLSLSLNGIWVAFAVCITIIAGTFHNVFSLAAFAFAFIAIMELSEENALCFMMFVMPFANIFKISPDAQSFFTYLILFYVLLHFIKHHFIDKTFLISFLCLLVFLAGQLVLSVNVLRLIKFVANILLVYIAVNLRFRNNAKKVYLCYIYGIALSSLVAAFNVIPNLVDYIGLNDIRYEYEWVSRFAGMYGDPNYYTINLIISLCLIVILNHKKQLANLPSVCFALLFVVFAGMTLSKSALLMLMLPAMLLLYSKIKKKNYLVFACLTVAGIVFVNELFSGKIELFNAIVYRLTQATDVTKLTTGRYKIWQTYLTFLFENPATLFFGRGFGAKILNSRAAHNTYIDLIYYMGIFGTALLIIAFFTMIGIKRKPQKRNFLNYSVWLCIAVMYFFLSELFYFDWAFHVIIAILVSRTSMNQNQRGEGYEEVPA